VSFNPELLSPVGLNRCETLHRRPAPIAPQPSKPTPVKRPQATSKPKSMGVQSVRNRRDATRVDGARRSVQRHAAVATREIVSEDFFHVSNELSFPRMGSKTPPETPPHESGDFKWKDYCPVVFHKLREAFAIDQGEYVRSLCGDQVGCQLSAPIFPLEARRQPRRLFEPTR